MKTLLLVGGQIHDFKGCGQVIEDILRADGRFDAMKVEEDLSALEATRLTPYDLLVFYYTVGEISDTQLNGLSQFIAKGKGFVGIHSAADSFRDSPDYRALIGGYFVTHPRFRQYQVSIVDSEHPITKDMVEFTVEDEQYILDYDFRVNILCSALWRGKAMPVAWTKPWGKGRVFYLALGHNPEACRQEAFKSLLTRGAYWAGTPGEQKP